MLRELYSVFPTEGSTEGGTYLTISGTGFTSIGVQGGTDVFLVDPDGVEENIVCIPLGGACTVDCPTTEKAMCETPPHVHSDKYYAIYVTVDGVTDVPVAGGRDRPTFRFRSSATAVLSELLPTSGAEGGQLRLKGTSFGSKIGSFQRVWIGRGGYKSGTGSQSAGKCEAGAPGGGGEGMGLEGLMSQEPGGVNVREAFTEGNITDTSVLWDEDVYKCAVFPNTGGSYNVTVKLSSKLSAAPGDAQLSSSLYQLSGAGIPYTFQHTPTINSISPAQGSSHGGMLMTITGTGFSSDDSTFGTNNVMLGERVCDVVEKHDTEIVCRTRAALSPQAARVSEQAGFTGSYEFNFDGDSLEGWSRVAPHGGTSSRPGALNAAVTSAAHTIELLRSPGFSLTKHATASLRWKLAEVLPSSALGAATETQQLELLHPAMAHEYEHAYFLRAGQGQAHRPNVGSGSADTAWPGSCSSTSGAEVYGDVWWRAQIAPSVTGHAAVVSEVLIWRREDCSECDDALEALQLYIGSSPEHTANHAPCTRDEGVADPLTFNCSAGEEGVNVGQYLHLVVPAPAKLSFCGIKAFGYVLDMLPTPAEPGSDELIGKSSSEVVAAHGSATGAGSAHGFAGFALRRVSDDTYVAAAWSGAKALDPVAVWEGTRADPEGTLYTLDHLDYFDGSNTSVPGAMLVGAVTIAANFPNVTGRGMSACLDVMAANAMIGGGLIHNASKCLYSGGRGVLRQWETTDAAKWQARYDYMSDLLDSVGGEDTEGNETNVWLPGKMGKMCVRGILLRYYYNIETLQNCKNLCLEGRGAERGCEAVSYRQEPYNGRCYLYSRECSWANLNSFSPWSTHIFSKSPELPEMMKHRFPNADTKQCKGLSCKYTSGKFTTRVDHMETLSGSAVISSEWEWPPWLDRTHRDWGHHYRATMTAFFSAPFSGVFKLHTSAGGGAQLYLGQSGARADPSRKQLVQSLGLSKAARSRLPMVFRGTDCVRHWGYWGPKYCNWADENYLYAVGSCKCQSLENDCRYDHDCLPGLECAWNVSAAIGRSPGMNVCVPRGMCNASAWVPGPSQENSEWVPSCPSYTGGSHWNIPPGEIKPNDKGVVASNSLYLAQGEVVYMEVQHLVDREVGYFEQDPADHLSVHMAVAAFPTQLSTTSTTAPLCLNASSTGGIAYANCSATSAAQLFLPHQDWSLRLRDRPTPAFTCFPGLNCYRTLGEYLLVTPGKPWNHARKYCQAMGAARRTGPGRMERYIPGRTTSRWLASEPNDHRGVEDCVSMNSSPNGEARWNDARCDVSRSFVCHLQGLPAPTELAEDAVGGAASYWGAATAPLELAGSEGMCLGVDAPVGEGSSIVLKPCAAALMDNHTVRPMSVPTRDGQSGWRLVLRHTTSSEAPFWWPRGVTRLGDNVSADNYAALDDLEKYRGPAGGFEFKLVWPDSCVWEQWRQESNPMRDRNGRNTVRGFQRLGGSEGGYPGLPVHGWRGLYTGEDAALLSGGDGAAHMDNGASEMPFQVGAYRNCTGCAHGFSGLHATNGIIGERGANRLTSCVANCITDLVSE
ncbi:hypothetical protein CYMTET_42677 [Cymbomonas tetramitiformis]|uniref:Uncharacterized protein n=1 Tax=Cymbomonas tetramitiformis TaxID=36881 RepID=A0AAE0C5M0_9CHLO|nr:hypothetical protein CYMTET_42677 [Cymbomonas tetramitiformis]